MITMWAQIVNGPTGEPMTDREKVVVEIGPVALAPIARGLMAAVSIDNGKWKSQPVAAACLPRLLLFRSEDSGKGKPDISFSFTVKLEKDQQLVVSMLHLGWKPDAY